MVFFEAKDAELFEMISTTVPADEAIVSWMPCVSMDVGTTVVRGGSGRGVLLLTVRRLIFADKTFLGEGSRLEIRLAKVDEVMLVKKALVSHLTVKSGAQGYLFVGNHNDARPFLNDLNDALESSSLPHEATGALPDLGQSLAKVAALFEKGLLSEAEFLEAKRKILES